ncbi:hypothetical protein Tco_0675467 [Tanacetum coccineum]
MAALKYRDEHNKVGFLEKPKGSADYHQVLDFLRGSHIRYAITHDPIIYDSLVKQFWSTASLRASEEGPPAILATIDRTPYTITTNPTISGAASEVSRVSLQTPPLHLLRPHESAPNLFTSTNVEDETMGVSTLMQKVNTQESDLKAHKLLFKEVVGKLVKKGKSPLVEEDPPVRERTFRQEREDIHANQGLTADLLGPDVPEDNFAERMVALIAKRRSDFAVQRFKDKLNKPMTYAQQKAFMRTFVKNQSSTIYTTGWTMKHVKSFSDAQLKTEFDKIRTPGAELQSQTIRRSLKRPGADLEQASSKKKATIEDVEVPSNTASTAQHTGSSLKKVGTRKKRLGRKGVHPSHSTIPIEDGDPEAEHKMCIKYASDADSTFDDDTPVNFFAVVDWELLPIGLGLINVFYRKDNSRKCFTSLREILHLVTRADLMTIYGRVMTFYQDKQAAGVGLVLWGDLKVLMDSPEVSDGSDVWKNRTTFSIQKLEAIFLNLVFSGVGDSLLDLLYKV